MREKAKLKKSLSVLLCLAMCVSMLMPVSAAQKEPEAEAFVEEKLAEDAIDAYGSEADSEIAEQAEAESDDSETATGSEETEVVYFDGSDGILQAGGLNKPVSAGDGEEVLGADEDAFELGFAAVGRAIDNWNGTAKTITVDLKGYNIPENKGHEFWEGAVNRNPKGFFLSSQCGIYSDEDYLTKIEMHVLDGFDKASVEAFDKKVHEVMAGVDPEWTDVQKVLYIHDHLVTNIDYERYDLYPPDGEGKKEPKYYSAYDALVRGECVCQGYSLAFEYLINKLGKDFDCDVITSNGLNHAWNVITVHGKKYYVDCTWDDPIGCYKYFCRYENFLKSRAVFSGTSGPEGSHGDATDWVDSYGHAVYSMATGNEFDDGEEGDDVIWKDMTCHIPMEENMAYYLTSTHNASYVHTINIMSYDFATGTSSSLPIRTFTSQWKDWGTSYVTSGVYTGLELLGDYLIATGADSIYAYNLYNPANDSVPVNGFTGKCIYFCKLKGKNLEYQTGTTFEHDEATVTDEELDLSNLDTREDQTGFAVDPAEKEVKFNSGDFKIKAVNAKTPVTYSSNDETVATVAADGTVQIKGVGETLLVASAEESESYRKAKAVCELKVTKGTASVSNKETELYYDKPNTVSENLAALMPKDAGKITARLTKIARDADTVFVQDPVINNNVLMFETKASEVELANTELSVKILSDNYSDVTVDLTYKYVKSTKDEPGTDPEPKPEPEPEPVPVDPLFHETFSPNVKDDAGKNIVISVDWSKSVPYNAKKHADKSAKAKKNLDQDVVIILNDSISDCAVPVFKFKYNKNMSETASPEKKPCFTLSYKAKPGVPKEKKAFIKALNKDLKYRTPFRFEITKAVLDDYKILEPVKFNLEKQSVSKLTITNGKDTLKLKKKDFKAEFTADGYIIFTGVGSYTGTLKYKIPGMIL